MPEPKLIGYVLICTKEMFTENEQPDETDGSVLEPDLVKAKQYLAECRANCSGAHRLVPVYVD